MDFLKILEAHYRKYPLMQTDDMMKLAYQNEFGCGHLIRSEEESLKNITEEWHRMKNRSDHGEGYAEDIGNGYCRLYLDACGELAPEYVNRMFVFSANNSGGDPDSFLLKKETVRDFAMANLYDEDVRRFMTDYDRGGEISTCHHSADYRNAYSPSYRVMLAPFGEYFTVFAAIAKLLEQKKSPVVSIDGPAASGKTLLASLISAVFRCSAVHTDDFFLPSQRKTPERMAQPGGNTDYERFYEEVVKPLKKGEGGEYGVYSCGIGTFAGKKRFYADRMTLIEGSYCNHEYFGDYCDLKVFLDTPEETCMERLESRETPEKMAKFENIWLPAEKMYFKEMHVREKCDIIADGEIYV